MERTYDIFADNGLFILAYYLKKSIEDITFEDIEDSVEFMSEKVEEFLECEKYSNLKTMVLFNSAVSNPSMKNVKLETVLKGFLEEKGEDYCMICGKNHANLNMKLKGRSYLPNRSGGTFFNFSNNLHNINVCPYCLLLTTYSVMNCRVDEHVYLYNSSDDEFMEEYTIERQKENKVDIQLKAKKEKKNKRRIDTILDLIDYNITFESDIEIYRFANGKNEEIANGEKINFKNIKLLRKMYNKSLSDEFKSLNLSWMIVDNKIHSRYINYVYDFEEEKLKCSRDLFDFLNEEVNMVDKNTIELISKITKKIIDAGLDTKKIRSDLRNINNLRNFGNELMKISDRYYEKTGEKLFDKEEYNELINFRTYIDIRNMIIIDLI